MSRLVRRENSASAEMKRGRLNGKISCFSNLCRVNHSAAVCPHHRQAGSELRGGHSSDEQNLLLDVGVPKSTAIKLASADKKTREIFINALVGGKDPQGICALIDKSLSPYQSKKKVKFGIKSSGFLLNSINHAVETMREGGMDIGFTTKENDVSTVLTLTVPKDRENVPRGTSK